jgi:hypothetical protein
MGSIILNAIIKYVEAHPDVIEKLLDALVTEILSKIPAKA